MKPANTAPPYPLLNIFELVIIPLYTKTATTTFCSQGRLKTGPQQGPWRERTLTCLSCLR